MRAPAEAHVASTHVTPQLLSYARLDRPAALRPEPGHHRRLRRHRDVRRHPAPARGPRQARRPARALRRRQGLQRELAEKEGRMIYLLFVLAEARRKVEPVVEEPTAPLWIPLVIAVCIISSAEQRE